MMTTLITIGIYLLGVVVAIIITAWINSYEPSEELPAIFSILSWLYVIVGIVILMLVPCEIFYNWCLDKFKKMRK